MPDKPKPKKIGRPKLPKGEAMGKIVALRFNAEDRKRLEAAAKISKKTVSEWIRDAVAVELRQTLAITNHELGSRSTESRKVRREMRSIDLRGGLRGEAI